MTNKKKKLTFIVVPVLEDFYMSKIAFESYKASVAREMIKNELTCIYKEPSIVYHYTKKSNVESILKEGLNSGIDGGVFVCTSFDEARNYLENNIIGAEFIMSLRGVMTPNTSELEDYVVLEFKPDNSRPVNWYKRIDNSNILFYHGDLRIKDVEVIELGGNSDDTN